MKIKKRKRKINMFKANFIKYMYVNIFINLLNYKKKKIFFFGLI